LEFYYQPELTKQEIDEGAFRPDNVVGSYAVYHSTKRNHIIGQTNYKTGKAFHIYRPKIIDSNGWEVWGELNIDKDAGILSVTIPQDFIDNAKYPIKHAAGLTFGYLTIGSSQRTQGSNDLWGSKFTSPADIDTIINLSAYFSDRSGPDSNFKGVVVLHSNLNIVNNGVGGITLIGATGWAISTFATPPTLSANTDYVLMVTLQTASVKDFNYDTGDANQGHYDLSNSYTAPENPTDANTNTDKYSIYATYTAAEEEGVLPPPPPPPIFFE